MIAARLYSTVFLYTIIALSIFVANRYSRKSFWAISQERYNYLSLIFCIILALWIGQRPLSSAFGDSYYYAHTYSLMRDNIYGAYQESNEWLWNQMSVACSRIMDIHGYFTLIALGYVGFQYLAARILTPNNAAVTFLFMLGAFSFFSYGTNGIRNGLACSMILVAIALMTTSRKSLPAVLAISFFAMAIHRSTMLPVAALLASAYFIRSFRWAYTFWILSIIVSLVAGGAVSAIFAGMGFDDRLSYITADAEAGGMFSHTGFRWDFLIYSMMPIVLGYYVVIKRGIRDRGYEILLNTYTLANAFWVMIIRANYSNRFAYLSWFMYPVVLAYPLLKVDIWGAEQGKYLRRIMLAQIAFTWFMQTIY